MIVVVGLVHLFQFIVFYSLYRINNSAGGLRFWLAWSLLEVAGFTLMFLREVPGLFEIVVILQNGSIIGGIVCLYLGVVEFIEGKITYKIALTGFITFLLLLSSFLFIHDDKNIRGIIINITLSTFSLLVAFKLFRMDINYLRNSSRILGATFVIHALIFIYRSVDMVFDPSVAEFFNPHIWNVIPAFDAFAVSLVWTFGFFLMVNKRLIHEKELNREYFESVFYGSPDAVVITNVGEGRFIDCNTAFTNTFGFTRDEVIGKTTTEIGLWVDLDSRKQLIESVLTQNNISNFEAEFRRDNGEIRNCLISTTIIKRDANNVMLSVMKDITQLKQTEEEVKRSEEKYRLLTETTPDFVLLHDLDLRILYINTSALNILGYSLEELSGAKLSAFIPGKYFSDLQTRKGQRLAGDFGIFQYNIEVIKKDGTTLPVEVRSAPVIRDGVPVSFVIVARDITEQLKQLEELREAKETAEEMNRMKSHFLSNMSHELRTPFVGILGYAQILSETVTDSDALSMIGSIVESSKRLTDTLDKILSLSRLEFSEVNISPERIGVNNIIRDVLATHTSGAEKKDLALVFEPLPGSPLIFSDRKILTSILDKLVSNAVKYSEKGSVTVTAEVIDSGDGKGKLLVAVRDEGIGIEPDVQDVIWLPFRQASEGRGRSFEGTGLGLSITRRFVELLGGEISLISKPGAGSVFSFVIPVELPGDTDKLIA